MECFDVWLKSSKVQRLDLLGAGLLDDGFLPFKSTPIA
jgi:hypothetical protein